MTVVSSHLKRYEFKMRVLIVSAFCVYAAAAPSGLITPYIYQPLVIPAAVPTISPGDIQAAAINAQVQVNDLVRAAADKAQEFADKAVQNVYEKAVTDVDQINEKNVEAFWSNEDKKWQALDALKTAEAQIDGAAANNADIYAKTAVGAVPVVAVAPVDAAPKPAIIYNPYLPAIKTVSTQTVEIKAEEKKEENQEVTVDAAVKSMEPEKVEAPVEKAEDKPAEKALVLNKPAVFTSSIIHPLPGLVVPAVGPIVAQPIVKYAAFPAVHGALVPTFVQKVW